VASILALAAVYFGLGKFGLSLAFVNASASAVWPPTGMALAALLLWGCRLWPGVFLGAFLVNISTQGSAATSLGIATGNTLEALVGAWLVCRFARGLKAFERVGSTFRFVLLAAALSPTVSASFGVTSLCLGGYASWAQAPAVWFTWWLGDFVGASLITPLILIWTTQSFLRLRARKLLELAGLILVLLLLDQFIFLDGISPAARNQFKYLAVLPLLWAGFRFGQHGVITSVFAISGVALWGTLHGLGPFVTPEPNKSLLLLQAFIGTLTMIALVLASAILERKRAEQRLQLQEAVSRTLAESSDLNEATPHIIRTLCEMAGWDAGAIWNVDRKANELYCVGVWHLSSTPVPEFEALTRQRRFAPGIGLPGRVWSNGQPAWIPDVTEDGNFPRAAAAMKEGLHSAFCFPIKLGDDILGVMECFSRQIRKPDEDFLEMLPPLGSQLGQFIERKRAAADSAHLAAIVQSSSDAIISKTLEGTITSWNEAATDMFGYLPAEIIGHSIRRLIPPEREHEEVHFLARIRAGERVGHLETERLTKTGRRLSVSLTISPIKNGEGKIIGASKIIRDITGRKQAAERLRQSEQRKNAVLDSALDAIVSIDHEGRFIEFNPAAERMFGYERAQAMGRSMAELIIPQRYREPHRRGLAHFLATGEGPVLGRRIEMSALRADGGEFPVELAIVPIALPGAPPLFTAYLRDITERKRNEAALRESAERFRALTETLQQAKAQLAAHAGQLEQQVAERTASLREALGELESFSYSVSHDLRAPLRAMQGFAQMLQEDHASQLDAQGLNYLERIARSATRLDGLIQDVLNYSRVLRAPVPLTTVDTDKLVRDIIQSYPAWQPPKAEIRIEGALPSVLAHEGFLTQCISNLVGNAVKFVARGVQPRVRIWAEPSGGRVRLWVEDNGIGIAIEDQRRIFRMFERINAAAEYEGTGIGLTIVHKAVERMAGQMGVESRAGEGSRFWIELETGGMRAAGADCLGELNSL
jgi:PAS domain S-box-containing protein